MGADVDHGRSAADAPSRCRRRCALATREWTAQFDFVSPAQDRSRFGFADRGHYDREVLRALYENLPRDFSGKPTPHRTATHRRYVAMARRRAFFERRDSGWRAMLPYRSADDMLKMVRGESMRRAGAARRCCRPSTAARGSLDPDAPRRQPRAAGPPGRARHHPLVPALPREPVPALRRRRRRAGHDSSSTCPTRSSFASTTRAARPSSSSTSTSSRCSSG